MPQSVELTEQLRSYGSRSIEYHRAYRRMCLGTTQRIDFAPDRKAVTTIENGWALRYTDAINQALRDRGRD
jgi:hypothetical protein